MNDLGIFFVFISTVAIVTKVNGEINCLCNVHRLNGYIYRCPDITESPFATFYTHDYDNRQPSQINKDEFTSTVHCRPSVDALTNQISGWHAVQVERKVGFVPAGEGMQIYKCNQTSQSYQNGIPTPSSTQSTNIPITSSVTATSTNKIQSSSLAVRATTTPRPQQMTSRSSLGTVPSMSTKWKSTWITVTNEGHIKTNIQTTPKPVWITVTNGGKPAQPTKQYNQKNTGNVKVTFPMPLGNNGICSDFKVKIALQNKITMHHYSARPCKSGSKSSDEAVILALCQAPHLSQWKKDQKVKGNCHNLQLYTPVSPFIGNNLYNGDGVGILTECLPSGGFKVAQQSCGGNGIEEIEIQSRSSGSRGSLSDPDLFYTIRW